MWYDPLKFLLKNYAMKNLKRDMIIAHKLQQEGNLAEAETAYLAILKKFPNEVEALHGLGILYTRQEDFVKAIDYLEMAIAVEPSNAVLQLHLANVLKLQGLFSRAAQVLQQLITTHPDNIPAYNNLGTVYYSQGKFADAIALYQKAIEKKPDYIDAYYNLGLALSKANQSSEAILTYRKLLAQAEQHFAARYHLAVLLMQQESLTEAIQEFLTIAENQPNHFETQTNLATCYLKCGKLNEAKEHYTNALHIRPDDTQILFNLGVIEMQQGNIDEAIQHYQRALQITPDDFSLHNNLGVAFLAKQHIGFAVKHFQEALRLQPNNEAIRYTLDVLMQDKRLLRAPPSYITTLFDTYADHYDQHLLQGLDYQVPQLLFDAVASFMQPSPIILDMGCGTGLCGVLFKPAAKRLEGMDLSEKMLSIAAEKKIYDHLATTDILPFLAEKKSVYDLIIAGDVLVYLGDLGSLFSMVKEALQPAGIFAFNTEMSETEDYVMTQSGRFAHQKKYIESLAHENQFDIIFYDTPVTRMQFNQAVTGHLFVLQKKRERQ